MARTGPGAEAAPDGIGRASWGAVLFGSAVALAATALLLLLGVAVGAATIDPAPGRQHGAPLPPSVWWSIASGAVALGCGGFVAGRFAAAPHPTASLLHGVAVWALTGLAALWLGASTAAGLVNLTGTAFPTAASAVSAAVAAAVPDDLDVPDVTRRDARLEDLPAGVRLRLRSAGATPDDFQRELHRAFRAAFPTQERQHAAGTAGRTAADAGRAPATGFEEIGDLVATMAGRQGVWLCASAAAGLVDLAAAALLSAAAAAWHAVGPAVAEEQAVAAVAGRGDGPAGVPIRLGPAAATPDGILGELCRAFHGVLLPQERPAAGAIAAGPAADVDRSPAAALEAVRDMAVGQDRAAALDVLRDRYGLAPRDAAALLDEVEATAGRYRGKAVEAVAAARQEAAAAAGAAADAVADAALAAFLAALLGLCAAVAGALLGRPRRA